MRLFVAALLVSALAAAGCSNQTYSTKEYQQRAYKPRIDQLLSSQEVIRVSILADAPAEAADENRPPYTIGQSDLRKKEIGESAVVRGRVVAGRENAQGDVKELIIWDGQNEYRVAGPETKDEIYALLGRKIKIEGKVASPMDGDARIRVEDYSVIQ